MSRQPNEFIPATEPVSQAHVVADSMMLNAVSLMDAQQSATVRAVAAQIGYQLPADCTDPDLIQRDISANMRRSVEACLEVGRGLAVLKAACGHGNFGARLDVLGLDAGVAQKFMQAARKFSNASSTRHLTQAIGNQTKLFEMLVLDDEQLEELELTGQTGDLHLDKIATMSVKELRAALREANQNLTVKERQIADKNTKIDELDGKLNRRIQTANPEEEIKQLRQEVSGYAFEAEAILLGKLQPGLAALASHAAKTGGNHDEFMAGLMCQIERTLLVLRERFHLKDAPTGDDMPEWLRPDFDSQAAIRGKVN